MSEHYATALVQIDEQRLTPRGWRPTKEWVILCACGDVFEPRYERGTDSRVVTAQERIQRHISFGGNSDGMPPRAPVSQEGKP